MKKKDQGFTLVELLIVIVILGILATVTVFAVRGITDTGQSNACSIESRTLDSAIEAYYAQTGGEPTAAGDLVPGYLREAPDAGNWGFAAVGDAIPAGVGPDGVAGNADDRAAVGSSTAATFYSLDAGDCAGA